MNKQEQMDELVGWWIDHAHDEIHRTIPKAIEYGADDLAEIGRGVTDLEDPSLCAQAGIAFYALGKVYRVISALRRGEEPSADSWFDLGVYAKMAQRVQSRGGWPGSPELPNPESVEEAEIGDLSDIFLQIASMLESNGYERRSPVDNTWRKNDHSVQVTIDQRTFSVLATSGCDSSIRVSASKGFENERFYRWLKELTEG